VTAGIAPVYNGYQLIGDRLTSLPIGSTLDIEKGVFYWQPGPGFVGDYILDFVFIPGASDTISVSKGLLNKNKVKRQRLKIKIIPSSEKK
jgi:hypothetical protein